MSPITIFITGIFIIVLLNLVISSPKYHQSGSGTPYPSADAIYIRAAPNSFVNRFSAMFNTLLFMLLLWLTMHHLPTQEQGRPMEDAEVVTNFSP